MDVALYEKGRQLFEARVAELKAAGRWKPLRSKAEANLAEMMKHEAAGAKHTRPQKLNSTAGAGGWLCCYLCPYPALGALYSRGTASLPAVLILRTWLAVSFAANQEWNGVGCKLTVARLQMQEW